MALKAAAEMMDSADRPQSILRLVIDNMIYPITLDVIHKVCHLILSYWGWVFMGQITQQQCQSTEDMTYNVFGGTLSLTNQSINHLILYVVVML